MRRQQEDVALAHRHVVEIVAVLQLQHHVAAQLVEKLLHGIIVIIGAAVGPADDGDHEIGVLPDLLVADGRLEQMLVLVDPGVKVTDFHEGDKVPAMKFSFEPLRGPRPMTGWFGLQNHSDNDIVFFKEVAMQPLP